jgi:hypothetical protein
MEKMAQHSHSLADKAARIFLISTGVASRDIKRYQRYKVLKDNADRLMHVYDSVSNNDLFKAETQLKIVREVNGINEECIALKSKFGRFAIAMELQDELANRP